MDIIVKKDFTVADIREAREKAAAFRKSKHTSAASNVLNFLDQKKAVVLCEPHAKKFAPDARTHGYYRQREYPYVNGDCDCCGMFGRAQLFLHEDLLNQAWATREKQRRDREYATIVNG